MCSSETVKLFTPTVRESLDPHAFRTSSRGEERHRRLGLHKDTPKPPDPPAPPQAPKAPDTQPLRRRNTNGGFAVPAGSTMLSGPSGVSSAQMNLGSSTLLGGG